MARSLRRQEKAPRRARGSVTVCLPVCLIVLLGLGCPAGHMRRRLRVSDPQRRQRLLVPVEEVPLRVPCPLVESW